MRIFVLRRDFQPEPESVLRLRASRLSLLVSVRHYLRLERSVRHHQQPGRYRQVIGSESVPKIIINDTSLFF